ncbi:MAG: DEAD/DEAH box helicase, partial [Chloroflexota bacterium]|nr:DEAD/DEAH box helicase [Chloroflexota bacterium]
MTSGQPVGYGEIVLAGLKGFQRRTAEYVFDKLYMAEDSTRRFLIADEVGLGKTLVAAGVVAQAIDHLRDQGVPRIDIIYICSNQAIARQNVDRIRHHLPIDTKPLPERINLLPYRLDTLDQQVNLIALTPGTSFNAASAEGIVEERIILYRMLTEAWGDLGSNARWVFLGGIRSVTRFMEYESWHPSREIDRSIEEQFRSAVKGPGSELHSEFIRVRDLLADGQDDQAWRQRQRFVAKLRRLLAHACLDALEPDLVILDEFQRFRDLLNPNTTSGELAQRLFEYEDSHTKVRTLLLSATPYKMYTLSHESDDDHYRDFLQMVRFLEGREGSVEPLEESLREFRSQLPLVALSGEAGSDATARLSEHRTKIQAELRRVMSRTERRGQAGGGDPMLHTSEMTADLNVNDVEAYLGARDIATTVDAPGITEYWKSAPYLLSFMDRYRLSDRVRSAVDKAPNGEIAKLIRNNPKLQIRRKQVEQRRSIPGGNGRMRALLRDLAGSHLHQLLWLPPSLPAHRLGRDFERARTATKRLVFSSWAMVPRAVAVMASYDAERRYVPERERAGRYRARLLPVRRDAYSLFALITPSHTLAEAGDPLRYASPNARGLLRSIERELS